MTLNWRKLIEMETVSKITIPELEMFGYSSMNAVKAFLLLFGYEMKQLKSKYPTNSIGNMHEYQVSHLENLMHSASTYVIVVEESQDYLVASSILRTLIDGISVYHLIYHADTKDEIALRHYLYILDGISQKLEIESRHPLRKTDKITEQGYNSLAERLSFMRNNLNEAKEVCYRAIRNLNIYTHRKASIEELLSKKNWKFKSLDDSNGYKWSELHDLLPSKFHRLYSDFCNYLSQYVHGLSMSNLTIDTDDKEIYEPLSNNIILILNFIHESMVNDFGVDISFLTKGLIGSDNFHAYLSYCTESYKNELLQGSM